ncbi:MAG: SpoIID/LytB domain-containing protein, partial [Bifidobacteriaceae bacterium]|nr:SpoIID/LytB domain-containing protein [Bifidobacteriaceae bacterium]
MNHGPSRLTACLSATAFFAVMATPSMPVAAAAWPVASSDASRGYLHLQAPKYAETGDVATCRVHWEAAGRGVSGIVAIQVREDAAWRDLTQVRVRQGRGTWRADVDETATYRAMPVNSTDHPDTFTPPSAVRKIAARQVVSKVSAPILAASSYFTAENSTVTMTAKWLYQGKRVTGKVKLQANTSGTAWKTVARGVTTKGKATFKVTVARSTKYRVVGTSTSSHRGRIRVGATYASSPVVAVAARPRSGGVAKGSFRITGSGFGHGVGMSQYGAQAMALAGRSAEQILTHYYTGTSVVDRTLDQTVRVQIGTDSSAPTVSFADGAGRVRIDDVDVATPGAGDKIRLTATGTEVAVAAISSSGATTIATGASVRLTSEGTMSLTGARGTYRRGSLEATAIGGRVNIVNVVRLDTDYVYGLAEVPRSWAPAALQAQAIAARNYAVVNSGSVKPDCNCHLYDDTRSQVYTGWTKETEAVYGTAWKAAVDATAGKLVVNAAGDPINAYYSSSSGGRTENSEDVWSAALTYARSVDDPWSLDPASHNPNITWTKTISGTEAAKAFGLSDVASIRVTQRTAGGNASEVEGTSSSGVVKT